MKLAYNASTAVLLAATFPVMGHTQEMWFPYSAVETTPAFSVDGIASDVTYQPLEKASKAWDICVSFPHMKDAYWLGVDYGVVAEAERLGVNLNVVEAGGYTELSTQVSQIEDCVSSGADAVLLGAISYEGLNNVITEISKQGVPVVDMINGVSSTDIAARSRVSFYTIGYEAGKYLAELHPAGTDSVTVGWFPGPAGAGWVEAANTGFMEAIEGAAIKVLEPRYGDTGKEAQLKLVEDVLQAHPEVRYIAGTAVTAEVAQGVIRERNLVGKVDILSYYITPGVYTGIQRGFIMAAPADSMVVQGRIAVDQAVRILEGDGYIKDVGPKVFLVDQNNLEAVNRDNILPPDGFSPVFSVKQSQ